MKRTFLLMTLFITTMTVSAQHNMQIWNGNTYTEYSTASVDSITFLTAPNGTRTPVVVYDTITKYFEVYTDENGSKDTVEVFPHYIGYAQESNIIDYSSTSLTDEQKFEALKNVDVLETYTTKIKSGNTETTRDNSWETDSRKLVIGQIIVAVPQDYFAITSNYFTVTDDEGDSTWYDTNDASFTTNVSNIKIFNRTYIVWTLTRKRSTAVLQNNKFTIKYN